MPEQPVMVSAPVAVPLTYPPRAARPNRRWTWSNGSSTNIERHMEEAVRAEPTPVVTSDKNPPKFIEGNDFAGYVQGWPLLAKEQSVYVNGSLHRRFDWGRQLILNYNEAKIEQMQKKLMALHREEEAKGPGSLRSLTPWQRGDEAEEGELSSQRDKLMQEFGPLVYDYSRMLLQDIAIRRAPRRRYEAANLLRHIDDSDILDDEARSHYLEIHDFMTTRDQSEAIPNFVESLIYGSNKGSWANLFLKPFVNKKKTENSTWGTHYLHEPMKQAITALSASTILLVLLAPIGVLYFVEPSKPISFAVVFLFATTAAWMVSTLPGAKFETVFLITAAYMAVEVTFLANFQGPSR